MFRLASATFLIALGLRLWFAFGDEHQVLFNACDASEYVEKAAEIQDFLNKPLSFWLDTLAYLTGQLSPEKVAVLQQSYRNLEELCIRSGPLYPLFIYFSCVCGGDNVSQTDLFMPVLMQCLTSALVPALLVYIGARLWDLKTGATAGFLAALYPGFIVNSARLLTEPFACFWLIAALSLTIRSDTQKRLRPLSAIATGICLGLMQLSRSALSLVSIIFAGFASILPAVEKRAGRLAYLALLVVGIAVPLVFFAGLQYLATGKPDLMVDRLSRYNLFVGMNWDSAGWLVFPYPNFSSMVESNHLEILKVKFESGPWQFFSLLLDKAPRLFSFPWNDFKTPIGIFSFESQVIYHQCCLFFALIGIGIGLGKELSFGFLKSGRVLMLLTIIMAHFSYMAFITLPRYALTAIPIILLFSAVGLIWLYELAKNRTTQKEFLLLCGSALAIFVLTRVGILDIIAGTLPFITPFAILVLITIAKFLAGAGVLLALSMALRQSQEKSRWHHIAIFAVGILSIPLMALPLNAYGNPYEWRKKNTTIAETIKLPSGLVIPESGRLYLMIDGRSIDPASAKLQINSVSLTEPPLPLMPFIQYTYPQEVTSEGTVKYDLESIIASIMRAVGGTNADLRQWFLYAVPDEIARAQKPLEAKIECKKDGEAEIFGSYTTKKDQAIVPDFFRYSFEKAFYGIENPKGLSDTRYTTKIALVPTQDDSKEKNSISNIRAFYVESGSAAPEEISKTAETISDSKIDEGIHMIASDLQQELDQSKPASATISVDLESDSDGVLPVGIEVAFVGTDRKGKELKYISPWVPSRFSIKKGANQLRFAVPFMPAHIGDRLNRVSASIKPGGPSADNLFLGIRNNRLSSRQIRWRSLKVTLRTIDLPLPCTSGQIY
ncbi:MAG: glycosyltransferase family 39 protein [Candidatus Obscuribacterales bacterium]|nr:glycosyltransferase family 39 protein [Cyanobacteria bacterium HKST-UBA01]MCB9468884.1 glycosyltransferase family 39 protein [Candidatus Obscuribacterales bacterium]